ncbi:MAG: hypothetical protein ACLTZM_20110 [Ruminococcus sp.]
MEYFVQNHAVSFNDRSAFPNVTAARMEKNRNAASPTRAVA